MLCIHARKRAKKLTHNTPVCVCVSVRVAAPHKQVSAGGLPYDVSITTAGACVGGQINQVTDLTFTITNTGDVAEMVGVNFDWPDAAQTLTLVRIQAVDPAGIGERQQGLQTDCVFERFGQL